MKKAMALLSFLAGLALALPGPALAGSSTDAALGLGAFAVFNQIFSGTGVFGGVRPAYREVVVAPPPVVVQPPPAVIYTPPPAVVYAPPPPVVYAPPAAVVYMPAPVVFYPQPWAPYHAYYGPRYWHRRHHHDD